MIVKIKRINLKQVTGLAKRGDMNDLDTILIAESYVEVINEDIHGEWWITDYGIEYADGDVGDMNHEMIAAEAVVGEILSYFDIEQDDGFAGFLGEYDEQIKEYFKDELGLDVDEEELDLSEQIEKYLKDFDIDHLDEKLNVAYQNMDAREYGTKFLGWKRVKGNWIETWNLTPNDLSQILNGIEEIMNQSGLDLDDSEDETFNIEVRSNNRTYEDIPWKILKTKNVMKIVPYRSSF